MKLGEVTSGAVQLLNLCSWRSIWDFDAPGISQRVQLERLHCAIAQARRQCTAPECDDELSFALAYCEALLALPELEGEQAESEGSCRGSPVSSGWSPTTRGIWPASTGASGGSRFPIALLILAACCLPSIVAMVEEL